MIIKRDGDKTEEYGIGDLITEKELREPCWMVKKQYIVTYVAYNAKKDVTVVRARLTSSTVRRII